MPHNITFVGPPSRVAERLVQAIDWCDTQPLCRNNLGIPRTRMPQILAEHAGAFRDYLREAGVSIRPGAVAVKDLRPTQREIIPSVVEQVLATSFHRSHDRPVWASRDRYILDGHHRWAAWLLDNPNHKMRVLTIMSPIRDVLKLAHAFPFVRYSTHEATLQSRVVKLAEEYPEWKPSLVRILGDTAG